MDLQMEPPLRWTLPYRYGEPVGEGIIGSSVILVLIGVTMECIVENMR